MRVHQYFQGFFFDEPATPRQLREIIFMGKIPLRDSLLQVPQLLRVVYLPPHILEICSRSLKKKDFRPLPLHPDATLRFSPNPRLVTPIDPVTYLFLRLYTMASSYDSSEDSNSSMRTICVADSRVVPGEDGIQMHLK
jgi:hypothetical protein